MSSGDEQAPDERRDVFARTPSHARQCEPGDHDRRNGRLKLGDYRPTEHQPERYGDITLAPPVGLIEQQNDCKRSTQASSRHAVAHKQGGVTPRRSADSECDRCEQGGAG
jgi:hypothetical protein